MRTILSSAVRRTFDAARFLTAGGVAKSYPRSCFVVNPIEKSAMTWINVKSAAME
jgi:hypothetical protein